MVSVKKMISEVPSPIDLRLMADASDWEATAGAKRPWRSEFFSEFARELLKMTPPAGRVLELGSGPGFLASKVFSELPDLHMTLLDFSEAMHTLAKTRLGPLGNRAEFLVRNFKDPRWPDGLTDFDAVITNQAVHELRHKQYAEVLHRQVTKVLRSGGLYLVCDHFAGPGGMTNKVLYMTAAEQKAAIETAGFVAVHQVLLKGGLVLHRSSAP